MAQPPGPQVNEGERENAQGAGAAPPDARTQAGETQVGETPRPESAAGGAETPSEKGGPEEKSAAEGEEGRFNFGDVSADHVVIADEVKQNFNIGSASIRPFSLKRAVHISYEWERQVAELHVADKAVIEDLLRRLRDRRMLVLTGEPDTGKAETAIYLGYKLCREDETAPWRETLLVTSLESNIKIDLREVIEKAPKLRGRLLIFKDVFAHGNRDILDFFSRLDSHVLAAISDSLRASRSFLIFTADSTTVTTCQAQLTRCNLQAHLSPLGDELLSEGLSRKLRWFAGQAGVPPAEIETVLSQERKTRLIQAGRTMPHIARFVDKELAEVMKGALDFEEALRRISDLTDWFLTDLTEDFDVWCSAFTLGLMQCLPDSPKVAWVEFERMRKAIAGCLTEHFKLPEPKEVNLRRLLSEDFLLRRCRAEIYPDPDTGAHLIRFEDARYPEMLWKVFLRSNRTVMAAILPQLLKMAEGRDVHLRMRAAHIIGRMGEMSPPHISSTTIGEWTRSKVLYRQAAVGYLYEGILASQEKGYRDEFLQTLQRLAGSDHRDSIWTAIATYKQLGSYDLPLVMKALGGIADRRFSGRMEDAQAIEKVLARIESALDDDPEDDDAAALAALHDFFSQLIKDLFDKDKAILFAMQYALVSLCLSADPVQVFEELHRWMSSGNRALGALVAMIFLHDDGIAAELEARRVEMQGGESDGDGAALCNSIVVSIASSENSVRRMARFLAAVFENLCTFFPVRSRRFLRRSFLLHLKTWARDANSIEKCRVAMEHLFAELLQIRDNELTDQLFNYLKYDPEFASQESPLYQFADGVIRRHMESPWAGLAL